jgi:hypothetical protein
LSSPSSHLAIRCFHHFCHMHLPAFLQIKTALPCRATWLDIRDVITALALHSASSRACCGRCLRCFSPPLPALAILWLGQSNQIVCEASAALLYCQAITPTQCTPYHQLRMSVRSPQESLRPEFKASAEQNRPHQLPFERHSSRQSSPWAATLQTPPQGCLVMLVKRRFARRHSVRYRCS